nr:DEAD/DEAH box helicase [Desulfobulbaceae bacterium]
MLPIQTRLTITPWFTATTLEAAEKLVEQDDCLLLHYRNSSAALFSRVDGYCLIKFEKAPKISQGFRPGKTECSICNYPQSLGDHCVHAAVLIINILLEDVNGFGLNLSPAPLLFAESNWQRLCAFMNEQKTSPQILTDPESEQGLIFKTDNFSAHITLSDNSRALLPKAFPHYQFPDSANSINIDKKSVETAWNQLWCSCRSDTETALNQVGSSSKGQEASKSLWTQLCHHLFIEQPEPDWQLQRGSNNLFSLVSGPGDKARLRLTPCRDQTIRLLEQTATMDRISIEGRARAYSKIFFQENGSLTIEPWLKLANGQKVKRLDLEELIFGSHCSLEKNIFHPIDEQEDDFSAKASSLPLFAFAETTRPVTTVTIPALELPAFFDKHLQNILHSQHDYDPALEEFSINDLPDFIEVLDYNEDDDWCYLSARYACAGRHLDLLEIRSLRAKGRQHATGKGKWLQLTNTPLDWLYDLDPQRLETTTQGSRLRLTRLEMMALTSLVPELKLPQTKAKCQQIQSQLENLRGYALAEADIPRHLRPYQQTGLSWLNHLYENGIGGILADDMGLGKTHQALALLQIALRSKTGMAMVVCPASVLPHWQDKIDSFYPELNYTMHYGSKRSFSPATTSTLLLTTYGVLRQDIELLAKHSFNLIFFDEIQYLKNRSTATSKAAYCLNSRVCFGLSGTPVENSLTDLKSIYDLCLPGLLGGNSYFQRTYVTPIEESNDLHRLEVLQRLIRPFMLRRTKSAVLDELPDIIEDIRYCYLSADQQTLYQQSIDHEGQELLTAVSDTAAPFPHMSFLALIQQLKQICNHPCQLAKNTNYDTYKSGKWELFKEILSECLEANLKVVVFSQYTLMLDIIAQYLGDKAIPYTGLRGSTTMDKRQQQVASFNNDPAIKVFCASLLAGGTGIDLTGAQAVIHYDRWWNSAKEEQATARVHRYGQKQAVQVFKFITTGTMEEKIHSLINKKYNLAEDTIQCDDGSILKKLSREEIASILQWTPGAS